MKICYKPKTFHVKSLALIQVCNEIIEDYAGQGYELTLRQLYYQLVSKALIANNEKSYDNIGAMISDARLAGLVDWNAIIDRGRALRALPHWDNPADIVAGAAGQFNYDKWEGQPARVEVWVEKEALAGVVGPAASKYDVPYFSCKGYTSQSEMWGASQRIIRYMEEKKAERVVILHLGDHDPSGLDMTRDIEERLAGFCEYHGWPGPIVHRIALNMNQVRQYNPPPNPTKFSDCRSPKYIALHGHESWELDALSPKVISALISKHILENMEQDLYDTQAKRQADARAELKEISSEYENVLMEHREFPKIQQMLEVDAGTSPAHVAAAVDDLRAQKSLACESLRIVTTENETLKKRVAEETQKNIEYINKAGKEIARLEKELRTAQKVKK
ncbi:MAG: hypothetical protein WAU69_11025 [Solirubrobacteraceae bacterium]